MNIEAGKILNALIQYLEENPEIRFTQALFNLNINQFANRKEPEDSFFLFRDNHHDEDYVVWERVEKEYNKWLRSIIG